MRCFLILALLAVTAAFSPLVASRARSSSRSSARARSVEMLAISPMQANIAAGPIMYGLMSVNEYFTHRYYQHGDLNRVGWFKALVKRGVPKVSGGGKYMSVC